MEGAFGGAGDDTLTGDAGTDYFFGDAGSDTLSGLDGDDLLDGGEGLDQIDGGEGEDSCSDAADVQVSCENALEEPARQRLTARSLVRLWERAAR